MAVAEAQQVAKLLREYAQRTALRGGNPYRAKAYSRAADSLAALAIPLNRLIEEDRLTEIPGVGRSHSRHHYQASSDRQPSEPGEAAEGDPRRRTRDANGTRAEAGEGAAASQGSWNHLAGRA